VNETEWVAALEDCYAQVLRALIGACGSREQAEDGLQDALAAAWKPGVRERIERPEAWLYRVGLRRIGRMRWRRRREVLIDQEWAGAQPPTIDRVFALELLKKLSRRQRELVIARYFLDLSYAEIGEHWGITAGTASATVSQALARLRSDLQRDEQAWTSKSV
jgi:RNA polymerase sigma factor (sigma-70 family)